MGDAFSVPFILSWFNSWTDSDHFYLSPVSPHRRYVFNAVVLDLVLKQPLKPPFKDFQITN